MRSPQAIQLSITDTFSKHEKGVQLQNLSNLIDQHPQLIEAVHNDLSTPNCCATGRNGLTSESILRCLVLKQLFQYSYEALAFHLSDSQSFRAFAKIPIGISPKKSSLQGCIRMIRPETLQKMNEDFIQAGLESKNISLEQVRIDSTVVESNIAPPNDSQLLNDGIRVLSRLMAKAKDNTGIKLRFKDHRKKANSLAFAIFNAKKKDKDQLYPKLLGIAQGVIDQVDRALAKLNTQHQALKTELEHYQALLNQVIDQTTRRVIHNETVPASEKLVSLFEPHTAIIIKGRRDVQYGHKVNLSTEVGGFITYASIEDGNTSDKALYQPVLEAHQKKYDCLPTRTVADGGYASQENVKVGREMGVKGVAFNKPVGSTLTDMGLKQKTFKKLKDFRAGVEGNISELKRTFGCSKARWKQLSGFKAFVWASILSYNLRRMMLQNSI